MRIDSSQGFVLRNMPCEPCMSPWSEKKSDVRVVGQPGRVELRQHPADVPVGVLDHGVVAGELAAGLLDHARDGRHVRPQGDLRG